MLSIELLARLAFIDAPGQLLELHLRFSELGPRQPAPPFLGKGLLHVLERACVPIPQVLEHELHDPQADQAPLAIEITKRVNSVRSFCLKMLLFKLIAFVSFSMIS